MSIDNNKLINNTNVAYHVGDLSGLYAGGSALVLGADIQGINSVGRPADFFSVVIKESESVLQSDIEADIAFYELDDCYKNNELLLPQIARTDMLFCVNYNAAEKCRRIQKPTNLKSLNYLPVTGSVNGQLKTVRGLSVGLSTTAPGVDLALLMGCTTIYYTSVLPGTTLATYSSISSRINERDTYKPVYLVGQSRLLLMEKL